MERLIFDEKKIKVVPIREVRPNSWNPKDKNTEEFGKIRRGIEMKGLRLPVVVRENDGYEIIDGEQRYTACLELGYEHIVIYNEGRIGDKEAMELTIWYQQQVPFNDIQLAGVIKQLVESGELLEVPFTDDELKTYAAMYDFEWDKFKDVELITDDEKGDKKEDKGIYFVRISEKDLETLISECGGKKKIPFHKIVALARIKEDAFEL